MSKELDRMRTFQIEAKKASLNLNNGPTFEELMKSSPEFNACHAAYCRQGVSPESLIFDLCVMIETMKKDHLQELERARNPLFNQTNTN